MYNEEFILDRVRNNSRENIAYIYPMKSEEEIAKYISAFSNGDGGIILFGIKDTGTTVETKGYNLQLEKERIMVFVDKHAEFTTHDMVIDDKKLKYIIVKASDRAVYSNEKAYLMDANNISLIKINKSKLFLSYCQKDTCIADIVDDILSKELQFTKITRDIRDTEYKDGFTDFMKSIEEHDFVLTLVSDAYLKSRNCMYEVMQTLKTNNFQKKLHFVVISNNDKCYYKTKEDIQANIYTTDGQLEYIAYWQNKYDELNVSIQAIGDPSLTAKMSGELNVIKKIQIDIQDFMECLKDLKGISLKEMIDTNFKCVVNNIV